MQIIKKGVIDIHNSKLTQRLFVMFLLICLIPSSIILALCYYLCSDVIYDYSKQYSKNYLEQAYTNVLSVVSDVESSSFSLTIDDQVISLLSKGQLSVGFPDRSSLRSILTTALKQNRNTVDIAYIETPIDVVYSLAYSVVKQPSILRVSGTACESEIVRKNGNAFWSDIVYTLANISEKQSDYKYLRCISLITNSSSTEKLGYLSLFVRTSSFDRALHSISYSNINAGIVLLDSSKSIISSNGMYSGIVDEIIVNSDSASDFELSTSSGKFFVSQIRDEHTGWHFISFVSKDEATEAIRHSIEKLLLLFIAIPFVCLAFSDLFLRFAYKCVIPLLEAMNSISSGNLDARVPMVSDKIVDSMSCTMNNMLEKYKDVVSVNAHQEALLMTSRLEILKGQLSPHFLYNTLDCLNWKLIDDGNIEASKTISNLGNILRYSIDETTSTVPLQTELDIIDQYLSICKFRFEDDFNYFIDCCEELNDYQIPRFLLQPIAENAIVHGTKNITHVFELNIKCYISNNQTIIDIMNNGSQIDEKSLAFISSFDTCSYPDITDISNNHIGLTNVYNRIKVFYGQDYGMSVRNIDGGVIVSLYLPFPN